MLSTIIFSVRADVRAGLDGIEQALAGFVVVGAEVEVFAAAGSYSLLRPSLQPCKPDPAPQVGILED